MDSWDAADDSEAEREKAKKAAAAKAAEEEAKKNKKSRAKRIEDRIAENQRRKAEADEEVDSDEDEDERRARLKREQKESDLRHAEDLFGDLSIVGNSMNQRTTSKPVTLATSNDPTSAIDLSALPIFKPSTKDQFAKLRETLVPLLGANAKKAHYVLFMQEFTKQLAKELPSDQIKKIASGLTTLSNEKMREEKAAEKGGKKSKAAKTKTSLAAPRDIGHKADLAAYDDDGLDE